MPYGNDVSVFVVDDPSYVGSPPTPAPWWISPDVDIPAHSGVAVQGANTVQVRVHAHDEPILQVKIDAEVYVGNPSLAMSPTQNTKRIDPGTLKFRTVDVPGTEPVAGEAGATLTFDWTPSAAAADVDGPGHRCLVLRAFPEDVTPPTTPFTVPDEPHEAQHNLEILTTTTVQGGMSPGQGGAGTPHSPRRIDAATGLWWERLSTVGHGKTYVLWGFDPNPSQRLADAIRKASGRKRMPISPEPPKQISVDVEGARSRKIDPRELGTGVLGEQTGVGHGVFRDDNLLAAAEFELGSKRPASVVLHFDHSNLRPESGAVLHGAQFDEHGHPEGGMTIVALAPIGP